MRLVIFFLGIIVIGTLLFLVTYGVLVLRYYWGPAGKPPARRARKAKPR